MEIEHKFLLAPFTLTVPVITQFQVYLAWTPEVRMRREEFYGLPTHTLTIKTGKGRVRAEVNKWLDEEEWEELLPASIGVAIHKTRQHVPPYWSLDAFHGAFEGLYVAECELPDTAAPLPPFPAGIQVIKEITGQWSVQDLARMTGDDEVSAFVRNQYLTP